MRHLKAAYHPRFGRPSIGPLISFPVWILIGGLATEGFIAEAVGTKGI
jgi:hypothetical protein